MMKKLFIRLFFFAALFLLCDLFIGFLGDTLVRAHRGGDTGLLSYIHYEMKEDVLFFGSSRCMHHYIPSIVDDSLGTNSFNCGTDGMGIPFMYARYKIVSARMKPKVIFYDVYPSWDIYNLAQYPNSRNLKWLKPYYDNEIVRDVFCHIDPLSKYKMTLNMYQYNGAIMDLLKDYLKPSRSFEKGYTPLKGEIAKDYVLTEDASYDGFEIDTLKMYYWNKFFKDTKADGIKVVLLFSPLWSQTDDSAFNPIKELAQKYNVPIINHYADPYYNMHRELFSEPWHLNGNGADYYTKQLVNELRPYIN